MIGNRIVMAETLLNSPDVMNKVFELNWTRTMLRKLTNGDT